MLLRVASSVTLRELHCNSAATSAVFLSATTHRLNGREDHGAPLGSVGVPADRLGGVNDCGRCVPWLAAGGEDDLGLRGAGVVGERCVKLVSGGGICGHCSRSCDVAGDCACATTYVA